MPETNPNLHKIIQLRHLTENTFVLRFEKGDLQFKAGQHIIVGLEKELNQREYSIYSGEREEYIEIMVREVLDGKVSLQLKNAGPGDLLQVNGPFGSFGLETFEMYSRKLLFISTGTGISPFHSFIKSYPEIDYTLIHGVRHKSEAYERYDYDQGRYVLCTSREYNDGRKGRVTKFLSGYKVVQDALCYLCGNNNMIYEAYHILRDKGIPDDNIFTEVYF